MSQSLSIENQAQILVVEDDRELREALADTLDLAGFSVQQVASAEAALKALEKMSCDLVISDVNMGAMSGYDLLAALQKKHPGLPVMLMTAYGDIGSAVAAMRDGAVDYLVKPFKPQVLVEAVQQQVGLLIPEADGPVAEDPASIELLQLAQRVAAADATVLIAGESGCGKEVLARYIHSQSPRKEAPFVAINCAAIPENMLEATLFGYEKGAFTGAYSSHPGKFEQANGGTLLLDEISEMDLGLQAKLLRVLQEREVERLGGKRMISLDVRVLATTNRALQEEVRVGRFREDLYYRLSVFPLMLKPLRERPGDIVPLAQRLLTNHAGKMHRVAPSLQAAAEASLRSHSWPGNVRELDNVMQRALILQPGNQISEQDLMLSPLPPMSAATGMNPSELTQTLQPLGATDTDPGQLGDDVKQHEYQLIIDALHSEGGRKKQAAERLGISPRTLRYKMAKMRESGWDPEEAVGLAKAGFAN